MKPNVHNLLALVGGACGTVLLSEPFNDHDDAAWSVSVSYVVVPDRGTGRSTVVDRFTVSDSLTPKYFMDVFRS